MSNKLGIYLHKQEDYVAYVYKTEDNVLMIECTLEFDDDRYPCYIKKRIDKEYLDAFEFICSLEDNSFEQKTKRPKKTKSLLKSIRA